jgi:hypothetical protein
VAVAAPRIGATNVGEVASAIFPEPVVPEARAVATPVPSPVIPVETGRPIQFVSVPLAGVPRMGETRVGPEAKTREPVPVSSVTVAIRLAEDGVARNVAMPAARPLMPVEIGRPVAFVSVTEAGVPSTGVASVGDVAKTSAPDPVSSVTAVFRFADVGVARNVAMPVARPLTPVAIGRPVALVSVTDVGVPRTGVTNVGDVA